MYPRALIIKDLTAKWAKINGNEAPTNSFGSKQWEMLVQTTDPAKAKELADYGLKVKEADEEGKKVFSASLKRKGMKANGEANTPVKIVDGSLQPFTNSIGNGSKVNVNLWQYEYEFAGRKGVSTSLTGVQVIDLVEYKPSVGFEAVSDQPTFETDKNVPF